MLIPNGHKGQNGHKSNIQLYLSGVESRLELSSVRTSKGQDQRKYEQPIAWGLVIW